MKTLVVASLLCAAATPAQTPIPLRTLTPLAGTDSSVLKYIAGIRQLPDGRVLVNDPKRHQLLAFDASLKTYTVVLDSSGGTGEKYGAQFNSIIAYRGDSTLFVDRDAQGFVLLDPAGKVVRSIATPKVSDLDYITNSYFGIPGADSKGRVIYRTYRSTPPPKDMPRPTLDKPIVTYGPDSSPILRIDFDARTVDTVAMIKAAVRKGVLSLLSNGMSVGAAASNPLPSTDEWAVLQDGTIAIARTHDYHVDWIAEDGTLTASPKMPFDWKPISPEQKVRIVDSIKQAHADQVAKNPPRPLPSAAEMRASGSVPIPFAIVEPEDLPDFYPPIRQGHVFADRDNNVWILPATTTLAGTGLVWDVVNRNGRVFERVRLPEGRDIAGFGPGGVVYLKYVSGERVILERMQVGR